MEGRELAFELLKRIKNQKTYLSEIKNVFSEKELYLITNWLLDGSLIKFFDMETLKDIIVLSKKGENQLFIYENGVKIKAFEDILAYQGYNTEYLSDFIKTRNLDDKLESIFSIEDYDAFTKYTRQIEKNTGTQKLVLKKKKVL